MNQEIMQLKLPVEVIHQIFFYLSFDEVSETRSVCRQFDVIASRHLTEGFNKVQALHAQCFKQVKDELPRRESERRKHRLYSKHDALQGLDTRLSLLKMTYSKYIMFGLCCFIPGKVLDELFAVLKMIKSDLPIMSVTNLLQEVRDISSMAMEHFDEIVAPGLGLDERWTSYSSSMMYLPVSHDMDEEPAASRLQLTCPPLRAGNLPRRAPNRAPDNLSMLDKRQKLLTNRVLSLNKTVVQQRKKMNLYRREIFKQNQKIKILDSNSKLQSQNLSEVHAQLLELTAQVQALQTVVSSRDSTLPTNPLMHITTQADVTIYRNKSPTGKASLQTESAKTCFISKESRLAEQNHDKRRISDETEESARSCPVPVKRHRQDR